MADLKVLKVRGLGVWKLKEFEDKTLNLEISNYDGSFSFWQIDFYHLHRICLLVTGVGAIKPP